MANKVNRMFKKEVEDLEERAERLNWGFEKQGREYNKLLEKYDQKINPETRRFITESPTVSFGDISVTDDKEIIGRNKNRIKFLELYKKANAENWSDEKTGKEWAKIQDFDSSDYNIDTTVDEEVGSWVKFVGNMIEEDKKKEPIEWEYDTEESYRSRASEDFIDGIEQRKLNRAGFLSRPRKFRR
jgi:hypothetical protein